MRPKGLMKRDMELIRTILLHLEASDAGRFRPDDLAELADRSIIYVHVEWLEDAGFVEHVQTVQPSGARASYGRRITWDGHEFLDKIRDPEIWRDTKAGASKIGNWGFKVVSDLAVGFIKERAQHYGLPMA